MRVARVLLPSLVILSLLSLTTAIAADSQRDRPAAWAQPLVMKGVPNLHKVSDGLYRSAQPTAEGIKNLKKMGITTVVSLRAFHSDREKIRNTRLAYKHIYVKAWHPEEEDVIKFLQIVTNPSRTPVLLHCQHGADRTGTICAIYRMAVQGWTKEEAIEEMTKGGFGFHEAWVNMAPWIQGLDIDKIKREAGLALTQPR